MKRKTCVALLALSSGLMMVFAANVDKCTEKFESCKQACGNLQAQCKARGSTPEACNSRYKMCIADCDKDLKTCQAKSQVKSPAPTPIKK
jgi:hypothetical protein